MKQMLDIKLNLLTRYRMAGKNVDILWNTRILIARDHTKQRSRSGDRLLVDRYYTLRTSNWTVNINVQQEIHFLNVKWGAIINLLMFSILYCLFAKLSCIRLSIDNFVTVYQNS